MAERRPLVIGANGCPEELPVGDTLPGGGGGLTEDFLSAVDTIGATESFTIPEFRQMVVHEELDIAAGGELIIEGRLFLEP